MASFIPPLGRGPDGSITPIALPAARPRFDPLITPDGKSAFRITGEGAFGLEDLMHQEHRGNNSKVEAVYFKTRSGNIYQAVGTKDGVRISSLNNSLIDEEFHFEARHGSSASLCASVLQIGKPFTYDGIDTTRVEEIEFVTSEKFTGNRLAMIKQWGAAKHTVLADTFAGARPVPDLLPRQAADLHNANTVFEFPLQERVGEYFKNPTHLPAPAMFVETTCGERILVFASGNKVSLVDINSCIQNGKYEARDYSSFWHPDALRFTRTLAVGDQFDYAVPNEIAGFDCYRTDPVTRIVPLENFGSIPQGIAPEDYFIRALQAEIKFVPPAIHNGHCGDTTVVANARTGDTARGTRPGS